MKNVSNVENIGNDEIYKIYGGSSEGDDNITYTTDLRIWFNPKGAVNNSTQGQLRVHAHEITDVLNFRFNTLYFQEDGFGTSVMMRIGLTTIEASEFDNVVETFLNSKF